MLKKFLLSFFFFFVFCFPAMAQESIDNFEVEIKINEDSSINVIEKIDYNFGENAKNKHGIYRDIINKYKARGGNFNLVISDIEVVDANGYDYNFIVSDKGKFKSIKIGDVDVLVSGKLKYIIKYKVENALNYFDEHDELYWNATGNDWTLPILQSKATVVLPAGAIDAGVLDDCYSGVEGSKQKCSYTRRNYSGKDEVSQLVFVNERLEPKEGMTIVAGFPKGLVKKQSFLLSLFYTVSDNWILVLPLIVFFVMFNLWRNKGKDPVGGGVIVAQFDAPDNLSPFEVGIITDENSDAKDISSQIVYLAVKGYLKIEQIENKVLMFSSKDYMLRKLKDVDDNLKSYDKIMISGLFSGGDSVRISDLKNSFAKHVQEINKLAYEYLVESGYFIKSPQKVRAFYFVLGFLIAVGGYFFAFLFEQIHTFLSFAISAVIVMIFGFIMPKKTEKGVLAKEYILGLKKYLSVAEKDRLDFHNAPEKNPKLFEKLLPYAMALGVEKKWAEQFEGIYTQNPNWYIGPVGSSFRATSFADDLKSFSSATAASGGSGSSGGGSSGGGGGGGGGGSW